MTMFQIVIRDFRERVENFFNQTAVVVVMKALSFLSRYVIIVPAVVAAVSFLAVSRVTSSISSRRSHTASLTFPLVQHHHPTVRVRG